MHYRVASHCLIRLDSIAFLKSMTATSSSSAAAAATTPTVTATTTAAAAAKLHDTADDAILREGEIARALDVVVPNSPAGVRRAAALVGVFDNYDDGTFLSDNVVPASPSTLQFARSLTHRASSSSSSSTSAATVADDGSSGNATTTATATAAIVANGDANNADGSIDKRSAKKSTRKKLSASARSDVGSLDELKTRLQDDVRPRFFLFLYFNG